MTKVIKSGDRVKVINVHNVGADVYEGDIGTVVGFKTFDDGTGILVKVDNPKNTETTWAFLEDNVIVILPEGVC